MKEVLEYRTRNFLQEINDKIDPLLEGNPDPAEFTNLLDQF
jgi:hypothetical protein